MGFGLIWMQMADYLTGAFMADQRELWVSARNQPDGCIRRTYFEFFLFLFCISISIKNEDFSYQHLERFIFSSEELIDFTLNSMQIALLLICCKNQIAN